MAAKSKERFSFSVVYPKNTVVNNLTAAHAFIPQGRSPPPPPKYYNPNFDNSDGERQQTPPTPIIIGAGIFGMLFFVAAIAALLLLYFYCKYQRADSSHSTGREDHTYNTPGAAPPDNIEGEAGGLGLSCPPLQLPESTQTIPLAVIMPGDEEPRFVACPSSLPNVCERASDVTESSSRTRSLEARNDD